MVCTDDVLHWDDYEDSEGWSGTCAQGEYQRVATNEPRNCVIFYLLLGSSPF